MTKHLWNMIDKRSWSLEAKQRIFLILSIIVSGLFGSMIWLLIGRWFLPDIGWGICFAGYPAVFTGFYRGILFLYRHTSYQ